MMSDVDELTVNVIVSDVIVIVDVRCSVVVVVMYE